MLNLLLQLNMRYTQSFSQLDIDTQHWYDPVLFIHMYPLHM